MTIFIIPMATVNRLELLQTQSKCVMLPLHQTVLYMSLMLIYVEWELFNSIIWTDLTY